jgi:hypothetical protein
MIGISLGGALCALGGGAHASPVSDAAAQLSAGQSIKVATTLPASMMSPDGFNFLQWGSSGVWDPLRREVRYIGKRYSPYPYRWLVYNEASDSWSANRQLASGLSSAQSGHGYDHNTVDPTTGDHYFRSFGSTSIYVWNGAWSTLSMPSGSTDVAASISWVPGYGVVYTDSQRFQYYSGGTWRNINGGNANIADGSYHSISEYNAAANVLIYGAGESGSRLTKWDVQAGTYSVIATPPFNVGSSEAQGVIASAPDTDRFVAWRRSSSSWAVYDVSEDTWQSLPQSTGNGSSPQQGAPNLSSGDLGRAVIGIPISTYGVIMFIQYQEPNASVWLYKVTNTPVIKPSPPSALQAN